MSYEKSFVEQMEMIKQQIDTTLLSSEAIIVDGQEILKMGEEVIKQVDAKIKAMMTYGDEHANCLDKLDAAKEKMIRDAKNITSKVLSNSFDKSRHAQQMVAEKAVLDALIKESEKDENAYFTLQEEITSLKKKVVQVQSELEGQKKRIRETEEAERRDEERKKKEKEAQVQSELEGQKKRIREKEEAERREEERKKKEKEAKVQSELEALKAQVATKKRRANVEISEPAKRERKDEDNKKVEKEPTTPSRVHSEVDSQKTPKKSRPSVEFNDPPKRKRKEADNKKGEKSRLAVVVKEKVQQKEPTTPNRAPSMPTTPSRAPDAPSMPTTPKRQPIYKSSIPQTPHPLRQAINQRVIVAPQKRNKLNPMDMNKTMDTDYDDDSFWDDD